MIDGVTWIDSSNQGDLASFDEELTTSFYKDKIDRRYEPTNHGWIGQAVIIWSEVPKKHGQGTAFVARVTKDNEGEDTVMFIITAAHNIKKLYMNPPDDYAQKLMIYLGKKTGKKPTEGSLLLEI